MSCQSHQLAERVQKMSLNLRQSSKDVRNMTRELADFTAKEILAEFDNDSEKCLISLHRKDVGPEFLSSCVEKVKHLTEVSNSLFRKIENVIVSLSIHNLS